MPPELQKIIQDYIRPIHYCEFCNKLIYNKCKSCKTYKSYMCITYILYILYCIMCIRYTFIILIY